MSRKYEVFWPRLLLRMALFMVAVTPWFAGMFTLNLALASFGLGLLSGISFGRFDAPPLTPVVRRIDSIEDKGGRDA